MLGQRRRRLPNIKPAFGQRLVFAGGTTEIIRGGDFWDVTTNPAPPHRPGHMILPLVMWSSHRSHRVTTWPIYRLYHFMTSHSPCHKNVVSVISHLIWNDFGRVLFYRSSHHLIMVSELVDIFFTSLSLRVRPLLKMQYCGKRSWPRGNVLGFSPPGSNFKTCVCRALSSHWSQHPQEVLLVQFSL